MNLTQVRTKGVTTAIIAVSMLVGVIAGTTVFNAHQSNAQTPTTTTPAVSNTTQAPTQPTAGTDQGSLNNGTPSGGMFKSNENPSHEATESPQREAQENAGQRPTVR